MKKYILVVAITILLLLGTVNPSFAQYRTNSNVISTRVGDPIVSDSTLAQVAISIANTVGNACGGFLRGSNINCVQGLAIPDVPFVNEAITQLIASASRYDCNQGTCLQCVGFVQAAVAGTYGPPLNNGGNAKDYATNIPSGYQYITVASGTPVQEGDIIIKTGGQWGHIAIVTQVYDTSTIQIAEANYGFGGEIGLNNSVLQQWSGFLRKL